jgi:uncharacterized membrane protein YfcA
MPLEPWTALPAGIVIAALVSVVGIGGGIFWMPFFLLGLQIPPDSAVLSSLIIQSAGMGSGSAAYLRQKRVDLRLALFLLAVTLPGVALGAGLARAAAPAHIQLILGALTLATALTFVCLSRDYGDLGQDRVPLRRAVRYGWAVSLGAVASGMLSISVGEWLVPILRERLALRMRVAVATSIATIFGTCVMGTAIHLLMGARASLAPVLWAVPGVLLGGQMGPRLTERINERVLKEIFIFVLTLIGIHLIYNAY